MTPADRERFDALLEELLDELPPRLRALIEEVAIIVLDEPTPEMLAQVGLTPEEAEDLCGLHTGVMATERSIEDDWQLPSQIHLFRAGIIALAGGFHDAGAPERVREQIRITLLHEIGHEFGLDEDDLEELGYD